MAYAKAEYETGAETMARGMLIVALAFGLSVALTAVALTRFSAVTRLALNHMTEYFNHLASSEWETPDLEKKRHIGTYTDHADGKPDERENKAVH